MDEPVAGFVAPVHRALTEPILMGGAPRAVAGRSGVSTLASAVTQETTSAASSALMSDVLRFSNGLRPNWNVSQLSLQCGRI
jgi:hypothetical protein